jgi:two-component system sensor histidine kinase DesK
MGWQRDLRSFSVVYVACLALLVAECFFAGPDALVFVVYIAVLTVAARRWWSPWMIVLLVLFGTFGELMVPAWNATEPDWTTGLSVLLVAFAMFGFFQIIQSNRELAAARAEVARLAAENERSRIARDLHDLLGHSLTTITVKAGLARRLAERGEAARSQQEITEVEQLSRRTLGDVRAAVAGHRDVTLAGELATTREVLRAAGISAELPGSVDVVDPELSEVFGWVVREGITNVVRHSHAPRCEIRIGPRWIEISDNGHGGVPGAGNGLTGLRERLGAYGGTVTTTSAHNGFLLRAEVPAAASEPAVKPADRAGAEA